MDYDANGQSVNFATNRVRIGVPAAQYARLMSAESQMSLPLRWTLDFPAGMVTPRTVVYDEATLQTGSLAPPLSKLIETRLRQEELNYAWKLVTLDNSMSLDSPCHMHIVGTPRPLHRSDTCPVT
jgi:hypothetical protein